MVTGDLLAFVRKRLIDEVGADNDKLISDFEIIDDYANEVRDLMFEKSKMLLIESTAEEDLEHKPLCKLTLIKDVALYEMSQKIISTRRFKIASQTKPIPHLSLDELDSWNSDWENMDSDTPVCYTRDYQTDYVRIVPAPKANDSASLTNSIYPLVRLKYQDQGVSLGFREGYHKDLIPGILSRVFAKGAGILPDVYSPDLVTKYENQFNERIEKIALETYYRTKGTHHNKLSFAHR